MYDQSQLKVPQKLDDPPKFFFWDQDVFLIATVFFGIGLFAKQIIVMSALGIFVTYSYSKLKSGKHPRFLLHMYYWFLPTDRKAKRIPQAYLREFKR